MAANERARANGFGLDDTLTYAELNSIDLNAAGCVNRKNSNTGWRTIHSPGFTRITTAGVVLCYPVTAGVTKFVNTSGALLFDAPFLPDNHYIKGIRCYILPAGGHVDEPAGLPQLSLYLAYGSAQTLVAAASYTWVSTAAYEAGFWLSAGTVYHTIDSQTNNYVIQIGGESGANSVTGMKLKYTQIKVSCATASGGTDFTFWA